MEHSDLPFLSLLIVVGLSFLVPIIVTRFKRFYIPIVIGEILAGILAGKSGFHIVHENNVLNILSELGFIFLMFLSGLEINFSDISQDNDKPGDNAQTHWTKNILLLSITAFTITLVLSALASWGLQKAGLIKDIWLMALILSTTSLGVVAPVLKEKHLNEHYYGQLLLVSTIIADFGSILLASVYVLFRSEGLTSDILLILVLLAAFAAVYRISQFFQKHFPARQFFDQISSATSQIRMRGALALALIFIVMAESLGTENILGAFLAGVIISMLSDGDNSMLKQKLDAIGYGFFIPIFFIMVGVEFNIHALISSESAVILAPVLIFIAFAVKFISSFVFKAAVSWQETFAAGIILSSRLSLIIAVAAIGVKIGLLSEAVNGSIILVALVTCMVSPVLFNIIAPDSPEKPNKILIIGCQQFAQMLANRLRESGREVVLICSVKEGIHENSDRGVLPKIQAHERISRIIHEQDIENFSTAVIMEEQDEENLRLCRMVKKMFSLDNIVAWVYDPLNNPDFRKLGVRIVNPSYSTLLIIENLALNPDALSMTPDLDKSMTFKEVKLKDTALTGCTIPELGLPDQVSILMIRRMGETIVPQIDTVLRANDVLTLAGAVKKLDAVMEIFYPRNKGQYLLNIHVFHYFILNNKVI